MSLSKIQDWMSWAIKDPRGIAHALENTPAPRPLKSEPDRMLETISGVTEEEKIKRLSVYADAYFIRISGSMKSDFPLLLKFLGDENFDHMLAHYLVAHPSKTPNIGEIGIHLSKFLNSNTIFEDKAYLSDLALFEFKKIETFYSTLPSTEKHNSLSKLGPEDISTSRIVLNNSINFLSSPYNLLHEPITLSEEINYFYHLRLNTSDIRSLCFSAHEHTLIQNMHHKMTIQELLDGDTVSIDTPLNVEEFFQRLILEEVIWDIIP